MNTATRTAGSGPRSSVGSCWGRTRCRPATTTPTTRRHSGCATLVMQAFDRAYASLDVLLGATAPTTAFDVGAKVDDPMAMYMNDVCTIPSNLSGHPAVSVPFGVGDDGLPVGVQVLAPALQEALLFRVAQVVEAHAPRRRGGAMSPDTDWEMVIGLEVHCELQTATQAVLRVPQPFGDEPNVNICPTCWGCRARCRSSTSRPSSSPCDRCGPALRHPPVGVRAQELLLPGPGRRTIRSANMTSR